MLPIKVYLNRRIGPSEATVVVLLVAVLALLVYTAWEFIGAEMLQVRVAAAMPTVCSSIREERQTLIKAIEAYKAHFGFYPQDHVVSRRPTRVDAIKNPLLYELVGVIYNPERKWFELDHLEPADAKYVEDFFQCSGFTNSGENPSQIKRFLTSSPLPAAQLHDDPDVFVLRHNVATIELPPGVMWEFEVSPWHYVSSSPTNNPGKFDLWVEVKTKSQTVTIGNWKAVQ